MRPASSEPCSPAGLCPSPWPRAPAEPPRTRRSRGSARARPDSAGPCGPPRPHTPGSGAGTRAGPLGKGMPPQGTIAPARHLGSTPPLIEVAQERGQAAQLEVALEDVPDLLGFRLVDG